MATHHFLNTIQFQYAIDAWKEQFCYLNSKICRNECLDRRLKNLLDEADNEQIDGVFRALCTCIMNKKNL